MNIIRFLKKCFTNPPDAIKSAKLVLRSYYGYFYWNTFPDKPMKYHLPTGGVLLLEPNHAFTKGFWPSCEPYDQDKHVFAMLKSILKSGDVFIDCGANVGYFSVLAADLVGNTGKVVAIEANPETYKLLRRNLEANNINSCFNYALTSQNGEIDLFVPNKGDIFSSLRQNEYIQGDLMYSCKVMGKTLGDIINELELSKISLIKIDIEGAEMDVIRSAVNIISKFRPPIIVEYGVNTWSIFGSTIQDLFEIIKSHDYLVYRFDLNDSFTKLSDSSLVTSTYANLLLAPKEFMD